MRSRHALKRAAKRGRQLRQALIASLLTACVACGERDKACLDFHHIDPKKKDRNVPKMAKGCGRRRILKEAAKCIVLCANCHRKLHANKQETLVLKPSDEQYELWPHTTSH